MENVESRRRRRQNPVLHVLFAIVSIVAWRIEAHAADQPTAVEAKQGMVVSVSTSGSEVGLSILKRGGNAVDAAVATALAMAVTYPQAGNIGGGGFMMVFPGGKAAAVCVEYRERAPAAAKENMVLRKS